MKEKVKRNKWIHLRLTKSEQEQIQCGFKQTTCIKKSDYIRQILLDKPITVRSRNQSLDDFMTEMIALRNELNAIGNNYNQVVKKLHTLDHFGDLNSWLALNESARRILLAKIDEIKSKINSINDQWLQ